MIQIEDWSIFEETVKLVREIHQRQEEVLIPMTQKIHKDFYGNGEPGLKAEHVACQTKIKQIEKNIEDIPKSINRTITIVFGAITMLFLVLNFVKK